MFNAAAREWNVLGLFKVVLLLQSMQMLWLGPTRFSVAHALFLVLECVFCNFILSQYSASLTYQIVLSQHCSIAQARSALPLAIRIDPLAAIFLGLPVVFQLVVDLCLPQVEQFIASAPLWSALAQRQLSLAQLLLLLLSKLLPWPLE